MRAIIYHTRCTRCINDSFWMHVCFIRLEFILSVPHDGPCFAINRDLMRTVYPAGATADINCSLCQAGTYGTGSGMVNCCETD
jgi:LSD1 subclass zinc finger protein